MIRIMQKKQKKIVIDALPPHVRKIEMKKSANDLKRKNLCEEMVSLVKRISLKAYVKMQCKLQLWVH